MPVEAGIVHQDVDIAARSCRPGDGVSTLVGREVAERDVGVATRGLDRFGDGLGAGHVAAVHDEIDTLGAEELRDGLPESRARARHERALTSKTEIHHYLHKSSTADAVTEGHSDQVL